MQAEAASIELQWESGELLRCEVIGARGRSVRIPSAGLPRVGSKGAFRIYDATGKALSEGTMELVFVQGDIAGLQVKTTGEVPTRLTRIPPERVDSMPPPKFEGPKSQADAPSEVSTAHRSPSRHPTAVNPRDSARTLEAPLPHNAIVQLAEQDGTFDPAVGVMNQRVSHRELEKTSTTQRLGSFSEPRVSSAAAPVVEDVRIEDVRMEDVRIEDVRMEDVRIEDVRIEDVRIEDVRIEDVRIEDVRIEETKATPDPLPSRELDLFPVLSMEDSGDSSAPIVARAAPPPLDDDRDDTIREPIVRIERAPEPPSAESVLVDEELLKGSPLESGTRSAPSPAQPSERTTVPPRRSQAPSGRGTSARIATRIHGKGTTAGRAVGIDLGTSTTCASFVEQGRPKVIPTRFGTNTIPSVLCIQDGAVRVGHAAEKRLIFNPTETIYGSKRLLGRTFSDALADEYQPYFAYPLARTADNRFGAALPDRVVSFDEVAERLLAEVKDVAEAHLGGSLDRVVITCPAYFGEPQRDAVRRAGRNVGLPVVRVVAEPTAAAIAYGYGRKENATLAVFDFGGGTFDISILRVNGTKFEVLGTGGDAFLGGVDVDDAIANFLLDQFKRTERLRDFDPAPQQVARLREAAEEAKRGLSVQHKFAVSLMHFAIVDGKPRHLQVSIEQTEMYELTKHLVERLIAIAKDALEQIHLGPEAIDDVLLVGGSSRLPQVQEAVEAFFGRPPTKRINPDEAVALGAALLAEDAATVELIDVLPLSIGFAGSGRRFTRLISRNTKIPCARSFVVHTTGNDQLSYPIPLFQGERADAAANEFLGTLMLEGIPSGPRGSELTVDLTLDEECFLTVRGMHSSSRTPLQVRVLRDRRIEDVVATLGAYDGPEEKDPRPKKDTSLGWFFSRVRGLFSRKTG